MVIAALRAAIAPSGTLRAGINLSNFLLVSSRGPAGEPAGVSPDIAAGSAQPIRDLAERHNTAQLGDILYTDYVYAFQIAGIILLVAMIGAIVLTLRHKEGVKRQVIAEQVARDPRTAIEVRKVESGKGI